MASGVGRRNWEAFPNQSSEFKRMYMYNHVKHLKSVCQSIILFSAYVSDLVSAFLLNVWILDEEEDRPQQRCTRRLASRRDQISYHLQKRNAFSVAVALLGKP